jgi:hypothetical protein
LLLLIELFGERRLLILILDLLVLEFNILLLSFCLLLFFDVLLLNNIGSFNTLLDVGNSLLFSR